MTLVRNNRAGLNLTTQSLVGANQQLLTGLTASIERTRDLHATKGTVVQQTAVFAGERHALGDALVDNVAADFRQTVDVILAAAVVTTLDRVIEQAENRVVVVAVVLCRVDTALSSNRVRPAGCVLIEKRVHVVAEFA